MTAIEQNSGTGHARDDRCRDWLRPGLSKPVLASAVSVADVDQAPDTDTAGCLPDAGCDGGGQLTAPCLVKAAPLVRLAKAVLDECFGEKVGGVVHGGLLVWDRIGLT
jgi:hypothetical protein